MVAAAGDARTPTSKHHGTRNLGCVNPRGGNFAMQPRAFLTVADVAAALSTSPQTVRALIESGEIEAMRLNGPNSPYRIPIRAFDDFTDLRCGAAA